MKIIYRIEHQENGKGYFNNEIFNIKKHSNSKTIHKKHDKLPSLYEDDLLLEKMLKFSLTKKEFKKYYFAFHNIEQILKYLTIKDLEELFYNGFKVYKITVNNYFSSIYQIMFKKENIVSIEDITSLFLWI